MSYTIDWRSNHFKRELRSLDPTGISTDVLWAYTTFADTNGHAWPTTDQLEKETPFTRPTIIKARKILEHIGLIERIDWNDLPEKKKAFVPKNRYIAKVNKQAVINGIIYPVFYDPTYERSLEGEGPHDQKPAIRPVHEPEVNDVNQTLVNDVNQGITVNDVNQTLVNDVNRPSYIELIPNKHDSTKKESTIIHTKNESSIQQESQIRDMIATLRFPGVRVLSRQQQDIVRACLFKMQKYFLAIDRTTLQHYMIWQIAVDWHDDILPGHRLFEEGGFFPEFAKQYNTETKQLLTRCAAKFDDWYTRVAEDPQALRAEMRKFYLEKKEEYITKKATTNEDFSDYIQR